MPDQHQVHGEPWKLSAYDMKGTSQGIRKYKVHCLSCKPRTCKFDPVAAYSPTLRAWAVWRHSHLDHGEPRQESHEGPRRGRAKGDGDRYEDIALVNPRKPMMRKDIHTWIKKFLLERYVFVAQCKRVDGPEGMLRTTVSCSSHLTEQGKTCPWKGKLDFDRATQKGMLRGDPSTAHGPIERPVGKFTARERDIMDGLPGSGPNSASHHGDDLSLFQYSGDMYWQAVESCHIPGA